MGSVLGYLSQCSFKTDLMSWTIIEHTGLSRKREDLAIFGPLGLQGKVISVILCEYSKCESRGGAVLTPLAIVVYR